jgi:two-component system phosphate regulon response regulator PhoB
MHENRILIVDDEEDITDLICYNLEQECYDVIIAQKGEECIEKALKYTPSLIVLDLMLPGINGLETCKKLKQENKTKNIPIIMLTAKSEESDIITGLELGADDYITKPFNPKILIARIKTILRRAKKTDTDKEIIHRAGFIVNITGREIFYLERSIKVTFSEFEILKLLISNPGRVYSRLQIMQSARGDESYIVTERAIDVQIVNLRKKLKDGGKFIKTVRGAGYKFQE